jgi:hypothetical protein
MTTFAPEMKQELQLWLVDELTILAEALGEVVTIERLRIYSRDLASDLTREQLQIALTRARRELRFFPKISELRELAGASVDEQQQIEAEAAWQFVNRYLRKWGVVVYENEQRPRLPSRIEYAVRRIGGLEGLNQITEESRPFKFRDFCEAYRQAPLADMMTPQLEALFGDHKLLSAVTAPKQLKNAATTETTHRPQIATMAIKRIPEPLTSVQLRDRRALLKQQAEQLKTDRRSAY